MQFFSVIIPTYNRANIVGDAIETVLKQSYNSFEVILVDDGSTDNTKETISRRFGADQRVRYFYKTNGERGAARNFGLKQARGDYAVFFDSDDWMKPGYLETLNQVIDQHPGVSMLATKYNFSDGHGKERKAGIDAVPEGWYGRGFFLKGNFLACNYCIRIRDSDYSLFPEARELASMEDWLFLLLNLDGKKIFIRDKVCVTMREHDDRSMSNNQKVITARKLATDWIMKVAKFTIAEKKILKGWSHYFCGIHQYLDHNRREAVAEAMAALRLAGLNMKFFILLVKGIIGRKYISRLK